MNASIDLQNDGDGDVVMNLETQGNIDENYLEVISPSLSDSQGKNMDIM